jgi:CRISPR-associated endonuclease Cas1
MNAKFLERMIVYRKQRGLECAKLILWQKIKYQHAVVGSRKESFIFRDEIKHTQDVPRLLLVEARAAKQYWEKFSKKLNGNILWCGRRPRGKDTANMLLDIGYHSITQKLIKKCDGLNLPTQLGMFHKAQSARACPLAYDFVELLRAIIVDTTFLKFIRQKKKQVEKINQKIIAQFVYKINKKYARYFFHRKLGYCVTLEYWVQLLLLEFSDSVNLNKRYNPIFPSMRNESRCKNCKTKPLQ